METVIRYLAENVVCKHLLLDYSLICKDWNSLFKTLSLFDCGMDFIECKVWHGDMELYKKLDSAVRDKRDYPKNHTSPHKINDAYPRRNPTATYSGTEKCCESLMYNPLISRLAYYVHYDGEFIVPAYGWIKNWLCENALDFQYSKFVVGLPTHCKVSCQWYYEKHDDIKISKLATTILDRCRKIPYFIKIRYGSMYKKIGAGGYFNITIRSIVYIPYLRVTSSHPPLTEPVPILNK